MMQTIIAIDPGNDGTGLAVFKGGELWACETFVMRRKYPWDIKLIMYTKIMRRKLRFYEPDIVGLEFPIMMSSATGQTSARSGALVKLTMLAGAIYYQCRVVCKDTRLITPSKWKGQLKKDVTIKRIKRTIDADILEHLSPTTHAWDAIGIGLHILGRF